MVPDWLEVASGRRKEKRAPYAIVCRAAAVGAVPQAAVSATELARGGDGTARFRADRASQGALRGSPASLLRHRASASPHSPSPGGSPRAWRRLPPPSPKLLTSRDRRIAAPLDTLCEFSTPPTPLLRHYPLSSHSQHSSCPAYDLSRPAFITDDCVQVN